MELYVLVLSMCKTGSGEWLYIEPKAQYPFHSV